MDFICASIFFGGHWIIFVSASLKVLRALARIAMSITWFQSQVSNPVAIEKVIGGFCSSYAQHQHAEPHPVTSKSRASW